MSSSPLDLATETKRRFDAKKQSRAVDETHARDTYGRRNPKPSRGSVNTGKYKSSGVEVALIVSASIDWGKRCPHFLAERLVSCGSPCARVLACAQITNGGGYGLISHLRRRHRMHHRRVYTPAGAGTRVGSCRGERTSLVLQVIDLICFVQGEVVAGRVVREGDVRVGGRRGSAQLIVRWNKFSSTP